MFFSEVGLGEQLVQIPYLCGGGSRSRKFLGVISALEVENAIGRGMLGTLGDLFVNPFEKSGEARDGPSDHEVVASFFGHFLDSSASDLDIFQVQLAYHVFHHHYFFPDRVEQREAGLWVADGQGYSGQASARADIEQTGLGHEPEEPGDGQAMSQMLEFQPVGVLAGDQVDLGIPIAQKITIFLEPRPSFLRQVGKPSGKGFPGLFPRFRHLEESLVDDYRGEFFDQVVHRLGLGKKVFEFVEGEGAWTIALGLGRVGVGLEEESTDALAHAG